MRPIISFLVGSGFSIPAGLPGVAKLNQRLSQIDESEILIHSDQQAFFLDGQIDNNRFLRRDERIFVQEFLKYYNRGILNSEESFHYETFYDYYSDYLNAKQNKISIEKFCTWFNENHFKNSSYQIDCLNRISNFNRTFNQLLATQLQKISFFEDISFSSYPKYDSFIAFLHQMLQNCDVKFHSLNHDLFFDFIGKYHSSLGTYFSDGYQLEGSPFYGSLNHTFNTNSNEKIHKSYYVKLEQFTDNFDTPLAFFKLHGSLFNTIIHTPHPEQKKLRLKTNYGIDDIYIEIENKTTGKTHFESLWDEVDPDFLSGTTNKIRFYSGDDYYKNLFLHFEKNLRKSDLLVVIGYGFQDLEINRYLESFFLVRKKKMIVIDPNKPATDLIDKYKGVHIPKGVSNLTYSQYLNSVPKKFR